MEYFATEASEMPVGSTLRRWRIQFDIAATVAERVQFRELLQTSPVVYHHVGYDASEQGGQEMFMMRLRSMERTEGVSRDQLCNIAALGHGHCGVIDKTLPSSGGFTSKLALESRWCESAWTAF